jgi:predicted cupin superfamily sugar epimerase
MGDGDPSTPASCARRVRDGDGAHRRRRGGDNPTTTRAASYDRLIDADAIIDTLGLQPHPEGGHYAETWRGPAGADGRAVGTAIHFLLRAGERSHWHRVDAAELWLFHLGAPLRLSVAATDADEPTAHLLGVDLAAGERPQVMVPACAWQAAETTGAHTLVSCTVSPGFEFTGFELAPPGWAPGRH